MPTNFLHALAPSTSGYLKTPFNMFGNADLNGTINAACVLSSSGPNTNGIMNSSDRGQAMRCMVYATFASTFQQLVGGNIIGWWVHSDGAGNFEFTSTVAGAMARAPDFVIPLYSTSTSIAAASIYFAQGYPMLPWEPVKVYVQNNSGATIGASSNNIWIAPVADQY